MPLFYFAVTEPDGGADAGAQHAVLVRIGVLSYGIYLIHQIVLQGMEATVDLDLPEPGARSVLAVLIAVGFAPLLDRYVDPYFRRRRAALH